MMEELNFNEKTIALDPDAPVSLLETDVSGSITIVVGPEGGFSDREKELLRSKTIMVNLGKKILRFETAAILTVGYIALRKQKI